MKAVSRWLRGVRWNVVITSVFVVAILNYAGLFTHIFERDYRTQFSYPLEVDIPLVIKQLKNSQEPKINPINGFNYGYLRSCPSKCPTNGPGPRLLIVVKSALGNVAKRNAIRKTWGYERRFSDVLISTVFLLGKPTEHSRAIVEEEDTKHGDIVQGNFIDSYFNNTLKTMSGLKWVVDHCPQAQFILFSDDDMYISVKNILRFIRNPTAYPTETKEGKSEKGSRKFAPTFYEDRVEDDLQLYAGHIFHSSPLRHRTSKWYVPLEEYPFSYWPPYATAGAYILSRRTLLDLYLASMYTKHFRFDDIFLGLVAIKAKIELLHCPEIYFWKKRYSRHEYENVIASHGYDDVEELSHVWNEQKRLGNA